MQTKAAWHKEHQHIAHLYVIYTACDQDAGYSFHAAADEGGGKVKPTLQGSPSQCPGS